MGRPNVGKSTLFNRSSADGPRSSRIARGTTRDRLYGDAEWNGRRFVVVDTGGLEIDPNDPIEAKVQEQARLAIAEADAILFVVDAAIGMTPADQEASELLRRATSPVIVAVNKADNEKRELEGAEFHALGWEETYPVSASHGRGTGDLLDAIVWALPPESEQNELGKPESPKPRRGPRRWRPASLSRSWSKSPRTTRTGSTPSSGTPPQRAGTPRWRPRTTSRPRSPSSAVRTSASPVRSTPSSGQIGRSCPTCPARRAI